MLIFFMEQYLLIHIYDGSKEVRQSPVGRSYEGTSFQLFQKQFSTDLFKDDYMNLSLAWIDSQKNRFW